MDEENKKQILEHLEKITYNWLDNQKEMILLQLLGFIEDKRHNLEHEIGSGKVQELEKEQEDGVRSQAELEDGVRSQAEL